MSLTKINSDKEYDYYKQENSLFLSPKESQIYSSAITNHEQFIISGYNSKISLKLKSLDKITQLSNSLIEEQIVFTFYKIVENKKDFTESNLENESTKEGRSTENILVVSDIINTSTQENLIEEDNNINNIDIDESSALLEVQRTDYNHRRGEPSLNKFSESMNINDNNNKDTIANNNGLFSMGLFDWLFLLLGVCGSFNLSYFLVNLFSFNSNLTYYSYFTFFMFILLISNGLIGFITNNRERYNNRLLNILCSISMISSFISFILFCITGQKFNLLNIWLVIGINIISFIICLAYLVKHKSSEKNNNNSNSNGNKNE